MIEVKNIQKSFDSKIIIQDVSAVMKAGQCNLIIGASGSGKTVLMKCMVGLFDPDHGSILYGGHDFTAMEGRDKTEIRKGCFLKNVPGFIWYYPIVILSLYHFE